MAFIVTMSVPKLLIGTLLAKSSFLKTEPDFESNMILSSTNEKDLSSSLFYFCELSRTMLDLATSSWCSSDLPMTASSSSYKLLLLLSC